MLNRASTGGDEEGAPIATAQKKGRRRNLGIYRERSLTLYGKMRDKRTKK